MSDNFYRAFEDRYRGSREVITQRLRAYLPFIEPLAALHQPARALDVGCGRGEWLELAASAGFDAHGVDIDDGMLAECRARGLQVQTADALATLRDMPPASLAMVSAFHVVEHIPFDDVRGLIAEALRVLQPGGLLIFETPNPENLSVGACSFYRDPSHQRPIPPELLSFATEHAGFTRNLVVRLQEAPELREPRRLVLQNVIDGVSPDYAVVAQAPATPDVLARFDAAFNETYGISLEVMARRYDRQANDLRATVDDTSGRVGTLTQAVAGVHRNIASLSKTRDEQGHRIGLLEARIIEAEARADQLGQHVVQLLSSSSWRITRPWRWAGDKAHRLRSAIRERRVSRAILRRVKNGVLAIGRAVLRRPAAKRFARVVLARFPRLQARLREAMYQQPVTAAAARQHSAELSPRAQRMLEALQRADKD